MKGEKWTAMISRPYQVVDNDEFTFMWEWASHELHKHNTHWNMYRGETTIHDFGDDKEPKQMYTYRFHGTEG